MNSFRHKEEVYNPKLHLAIAAAVIGLLIIVNATGCGKANTAPTPSAATERIESVEAIPATETEAVEDIVAAIDEATPASTHRKAPAEIEELIEGAATDWAGYHEVYCYEDENGVLQLLTMMSLENFDDDALAQLDMIAKEAPEQAGELNDSIGELIEMFFGLEELNRNFAYESGYKEVNSMVAIVNHSNHDDILYVVKNGEEALDNFTMFGRMIHSAEAS